MRLGTEHFAKNEIGNRDAPFPIVISDGQFSSGPGTTRHLIHRLAEIIIDQYRICGSLELR